MSIPRLRQRATFWAPRALVVISCALALLAIQPANSVPAARHRPVVLKESGGSISTTNWVVSRRTPATAARPAGRATHPNDALFAGTQRLHILATVDILQRLLMTELQPVQQHFFATLWLLPECPAITVIGPASAVTARLRTDLISPPLEVEKAFAMAQCQLAPPRA
jgi:hypothetical protein